MKKIRHILLFACSLISASCSEYSDKAIEKMITVDYRGQTVLVLDAPEENQHHLIEAIEKATVPVLFHGRRANYRPSNEKHLNGYSIKVRNIDGKVAHNTDGRCLDCSLYNNFPFSIAKGNLLIYNFKHLLSEDEVNTLRKLIPLWKN